MDIRQRILSVIDRHQGMTVRNVSLKAGLSDSALHKFLTGSTNSLTLETLNKLASALGVDPRWLAFGEGDIDRADDIAAIWERIDEKDRGQARVILETFARNRTSRK